MSPQAPPARRRHHQTTKTPNPALNVDWRSARAMWHSTLQEKVTSGVDSTGHQKNTRRTRRKDSTPYQNQRCAIQKKWCVVYNKMRTTRSNTKLGDVLTCFLLAALRGLFAYEISSARRTICRRLMAPTVAIISTIAT